MCIRNGNEESIEEDYVQLPDEICVPFTSANSNNDDLIDSVFPMLAPNISNLSYIIYRAILSMRNEYVDRINLMIECFPREELVYHSFDHAEDDPHNY